MADSENMAAGDIQEATLTHHRFANDEVRANEVKILDAEGDEIKALAKP